MSHSAASTATAATDGPGPRRQRDRGRAGDGAAAATRAEEDGKEACAAAGDDGGRLDGQEVEEDDQALAPPEAEPPEAGLGDEADAEAAAPAAPSAPVRTRRPASDALLEENARLRQELAEVHHHIINHVESRRLLVEMQRRGALQLELKLAACTADEVATSSQALVGEAPAGEELRRRRAQRNHEEQTLCLLEQRAAAAREQATRDAAVAAELRQQFSQQAAELLTRRGAGPADTFLSSLARLDVQSLSWVRAQIDAHRLERESATPMVAEGFTHGIAEQAVGVAGDGERRRWGAAAASWGGAAGQGGRGAGRHSGGRHSAGARGG